ncbi:hypothetical protein M427DRAFT_408913 [Gonapodya prolifera JEL478]|uniref:Uncharacterized protein n=1 Tax=Gonapodya prolifera (strain JEL478) TaxID=1344416 RepID=A0A139A5Y6_GONPJ|nr:hypothetical protein M427DRAFT_408913 [Gonapodya prolifera JEL478]|eukprot:KXS12206.1 hypothetical protein M427DRAFT_408913 [Gonapodya prolifera JEL478]
MSPFNPQRQSTHLVTAPMLIHPHPTCASADSGKTTLIHTRHRADYGPPSVPNALNGSKLKAINRARTAQSSDKAHNQSVLSIPPFSDTGPACNPETEYRSSRHPSNLTTKSERGQTSDQSTTTGYECKSRDFERFRRTRGQVAGARWRQDDDLPNVEFPPAHNPFFQTIFTTILNPYLASFCSSSEI